MGQAGTVPAMLPRLICRTTPDKLSDRCCTWFDFEAARDCEALSVKSGPRAGLNIRWLGPSHKWDLEQQARDMTVPVDTSNSVGRRKGADGKILWLKNRRE